MFSGITEQIKRDLDAMYVELVHRFPAGFPYDRNNVRLGIAALEDEIHEVWLEWDLIKHDMDNGPKVFLRTELLQVAAVALRIIEGVDNAE